MVQNLRAWLSRQQERRQEQRQRLTENIAHRLYLNRVARNRDGDEETDLAKAKKIVRNPFTRTAFRFSAYWRGRVDAIESSWVEAALEGLVNDLQNLAVIDLLNIVASLSLISTAIGFFSEADERQKQKHYQAWQMINSAVGQTHEAGRGAAIADLHVDGVSLTGLDINNATIENLDLSPLCFVLGWHVPDPICGLKQQIFSQQTEELSNSDAQENTFKLEIVSEQTAELMSANFQKVNLTESDLEEAFLALSNFQEAILGENNLQGADLLKSNLQKARLIANNLQGADLLQSNLQKAHLIANNLQGADLSQSNLQEAIVIANNLQGADLSDTDLDNALLINMDLRTVTGLVQEQLEGDNPPFICNTPVPEPFGIDKDRDCDKLAQALLENFPEQEDEDEDPWSFSSLEKAEEFIQGLRELVQLVNQEN